MMVGTLEKPGWLGVSRTAASFGIWAALRIWRGPVGLFAAFLLIASFPVLGILSPHGTVNELWSPGSLELAGVGLLTGGALALCWLSDQSAFRELLAPSARPWLELAFLAAASLVGAFWVLLGALLADPALLAGRAGPLLLAAPLAALHLAALAAAALLLQIPTFGRLCAYLLLFWLVPALLLEPAGWQGWIRLALDPLTPLRAVASESPSAVSMLPHALLVGALVLASTQTARSVDRIR